jgi:hypothetical protein
MFLKCSHPHPASPKFTEQNYYADSKLFIVNLGEVLREAGGGGKLPPFRDAQSMFFRQPCLTDALLHLSDIVNGTAGLPCFGGAIVNGIRRAWVAVTWLAHRTRVGDQPRLQLDRFSHLDLLKIDAVGFLVELEHTL